MNNKILYVLCIPFFIIFSLSAQDIKKLSNQLIELTSYLSTLEKKLELGSFKPIPETTYGKAWQKPTQEGYHYRNENEIRDKRKIVIFAYGSLVNEKQSPTNRNKLKAGNFVKTTIKVPLSLGRISNKNTPNRRVTVVLDNTSDTTGKLWAAYSKFTFLPNARNNLAAREGIPFLDNKYNLEAIMYIKKLLPLTKKDSNEIDIPDMPGWVVKASPSSNHLLSNSIIKEMAEFTEKNNANAAIWASFPSNASLAEIQQQLKEDPTLSKNTFFYLQKLPSSTKLDLSKYFQKSSSKIGERLRKLLST